MSLVIPDDILHATGMSSAEAKQEHAALFSKKEKLTSAQASKRATDGRA
jgi:hypothetical protein